jgi:hypothetical protein
MLVMEKATIKNLGKALKGEFIVQRDLPESMRQALQALAARHDKQVGDSDIQTSPPPESTSRVVEGQ